MTSRRMRAFKRWMKAHGIEHSDAIDLVDSGEEGIWVRALCPLCEGDVVSTIPKVACLTTKTSGARDMIEAAGLGGALGLAVAVMYERSLGENSPWAGYLHLLPEREQVPLVWSVEEVDGLLTGTELHRIVKEDKIHVYDDWKENIQPLLASELLKLDPDYFGVEQYFAAKSLVASRSFEIDNYHGCGMVPLADLFNHRTGAEDVHFTSVCCVSDSDDDKDDDNHAVDDSHDAPLMDDKSSVSDLDTGSSEDDPTKLEMIVCQDVEAGDEVFNTYGSMGNAALLHRYGFTEPENPFDIVNIDLQLVLQWSILSFSDRHFRRRLSLWRKLKYSGCISQNSEYFEITSDGEPQLELLVLLYVLYLTDDAYQKLDHLVHSFKDTDDAARLIMSTKTNKMQLPEMPETVEEFLMTVDVCQALKSLADARERSYGTDSLEDDLNKLRQCCCVNEKKLYNSLVLRVSERAILGRLRDYASRTGSNAKKRKI